MRGLTDDEAAVVRLSLTAPPEGVDATPAQAQVAITLVQLGRMSWWREPGCRWARLTPAGREAYRIYVAIKAMGDIEQ
jgi:hypothetical protein